MARKTRKRIRPVDTEIGQRLRARRQFLRMSQEELAGKLGLAFQQIQKYENAKNRISVSRLLEIAAALRVSPVYFIKGLYAADAPMPPLVGKSKQHIQLLQAFDAITDPKLKKRMLTVVRSLSAKEAA